MHVEGERDHAIFVNEEIKAELNEKERDMDKDVQNMRESIGETRHTVEGLVKPSTVSGEEGKVNGTIDHEELVRRVVKLDEKIAMATEARECRQLVAQMTQRGANALKSTWTPAKELIEMIKRMSICKCTLTTEQLATVKVHVDARALRIICHNFTTFARKNEDAASSYKAYATVDIKLPNTVMEQKSASEVEVKVKYIGLPLSEEEIQNSEQKAAKLVSSKKITESSSTLGQGGNISPNVTFNTKDVWRRMEEGENLMLAYQMSTALGGTIKMDR
jgi:hypothetical protein